MTKQRTRRLMRFALDNDALRRAVAVAIRRGRRTSWLQKRAAELRKMLCNQV